MASAYESETAAAFISAPPAAPAAGLTLEQALEDIEAILRAVASSPAHYRNFAVHYMRCRDALLAGAERSVLPGFLIQCGTSEKFREFILLYDASVAARHAFIDQALGRCRTSFGWSRPYDPFDDEDF